MITSVNFETMVMVMIVVTGGNEIMKMAEVIYCVVERYIIQIVISFAFVIFQIS